MKIKIFALAAYGTGISGGDRIFIEFARYWSKKYPIDVYLWTEGRDMCRRQDLKSKDIKYHVSNMQPWSSMGFVVNYFARILEGVRIGLTLKLKPKDTLLYSASEFWMDSFACFFLKIRYPKTKWVASWYQTAPNPIKGFSNRYRFSAFLYWLVQLPIKPLVKNYADYVLVNNESERKEFRKSNKLGKVKVVLGAVPLNAINKYLSGHKKRKYVYDAVFQGRFHPQKGVVELVEIWKKVVDKLPNAKLAMVGNGPLMKEVKTKIKDLRLERNIDLLGFMFDGSEKFRVFSESKLVLHPAFYDSGGMASAEVMAFGAPCVGFDLKSYESYYPRGMVKVKLGDLDKFADAILKLIKNDKLRKKLGNEAKHMIARNWSWEKRAKNILNEIAI